MIRRVPAIAVVCLATWLASACGPPLAVRPDTPQRLGGHYRVDPQIEWTRSEFPNLQIWTADGHQLQQLRLYRGLEEGDDLFPRARGTLSLPDEHRPRYRPGMRPHDVADLVVDSLFQSGLAQVQATGLRPTPFGERQGFRFDLSLVSQGGLAYRGMALGLIDADRRLQLILYLAAAEHYYGAYRQTVERIFESVELL